MTVSPLPYNHEPLRIEPAASVPSSTRRAFVSPSIDISIGGLFLIAIPIVIQLFGSLSFSLSLSLSLALVTCATVITNLGQLDGNPIKKTKFFQFLVCFWKEYLKKRSKIYNIFIIVNRWLVLLNIQWNSFKLIQSWPSWQKPNTKFLLVFGKNIKIKSSKIYNILIICNSWIIFERQSMVNSFKYSMKLI